MKKSMLMVLVLGLVASAATATLSYTQNFDGAGLVVGDCGWKSTAIVAPAYSLVATIGSGGTASYRTSSNVWAPSVEPLNSVTAGTDVLFGDVATKFGGTGISVSYWARSANAVTERLYLDFTSGTTTWSKEVYATGTDMTTAKNVAVDLLYADSTGWVKTAGTATLRATLANVTGWNLWSVRDAVVPGYYFTPKQNSTDLYVDSISFTTIPEPVTLGLLAIGGIISLRKKR